MSFYSGLSPKHSQKGICACMLSHNSPKVEKSAFKTDSQSHAENKPGQRCQPAFMAACGNEQRTIQLTEIMY